MQLMCLRRAGVAVERGRVHFMFRSLLLVAVAGRARCCFWGAPGTARVLFVLVALALCARPVKDAAGFAPRPADPDSLRWNPRETPPSSPTDAARPIWLDPDDVRPVANAKSSDNESSRWEEQYLPKKMRRKQRPEVIVVCLETTRPPKRIGLSFLYAAIAHVPGARKRQKHGRPPRRGPPACL